MRFTGAPALDLFPHAANHDYSSANFSSRRVADGCRMICAHEKGTPMPNPLCVQGDWQCVVGALKIICGAVDKYKELCEGKHCGENRVPHRNVLLCALTAAQRCHACAKTQTPAPVLSQRRF